MSLDRRLKKLEAERRPLHVVNSWHDVYAVRRRFGIKRTDLHSLFQPPRSADSDSEGPRPPTYEGLVARGVVVETAEFKAEVFASGRAQARSMFYALRRTAEGCTDPAGTYSYALEAQATGPSPYFPFCSVEAREAEAGCPDAVWLSEYAAAFEAEHDDAAALVSQYREDRDRREHERQRKIHAEAGYPDPGPYPGDWTQRLGELEGAQAEPPAGGPAGA